MYYQYDWLGGRLSPCIINITDCGRLSPCIIIRVCWHLKQMEIVTVPGNALCE